MDRRDDIFLVSFYFVAAVVVFLNPPVAAVERVMSTMNELDLAPVSKVVDLSAFKKKRETKEQLARARKPLYVNHSEGSVTGSSKMAKDDAPEDFADRLVKIRGSLDRINKLMAEIKKLSVRNSGGKDGLI